MISPLDSSVNGRFFISEYSSVEFGVPQIVVVEDIAKEKKKYSYERLSGAIAHEVGHIKDWFERGTMTIYVTNRDYDFLHFQRMLGLLSDQEIESLVFKVALASEEHMASEYAISAGYYSEVFECLIYDLATNIKIQELINESILDDLEEMHKEGGIKKVFQYQLAGTATYLSGIAEVCSFLESPLPPKSQKEVVDRFFVKLVQSTPTKFMKKSVQKLYKNAMKQPTVFHSRKQIFLSMLELFESLKDYTPKDLFS